MQIQLNNLLILISKSTFAIELHPIPSGVISPPPLCPLQTQIQDEAVRMITKPELRL